MGAVGHLHKAAARTDWRGVYFAGPELVHAVCRHHDVHDRIHGAHLVERDILDRKTVNGRLRFRQQPKYPPSELPHRLIEPGPGEPSIDVGIVGVSAIVGPRMEMKM